MTFRSEVKRFIANTGSPIAATVLVLSVLATPSYANEFAYVPNMDMVSGVVEITPGKAMFATSTAYGGLDFAGQLTEEPIGVTVNFVGDGMEGAITKMKELGISDNLITVETETILNPAFNVFAAQSTDKVDMVEAAIAGIATTVEVDQTDIWNIDMSGWVASGLNSTADQSEMEWKDGFITAETETILYPAFNAFMARSASNADMGKGIDSNLATWMKGAEAADSNMSADWRFAETETILAPALANNVVLASLASSASSTWWQEN
ncbi:hypothetical protein [Ruegeria atlantica]|uniref:hypothetical protein n=1 Tax=Ruegeria atlantica TaxID=81569 RepID=UPI00147AC65A|nr:hypothetical protein [Ruegeria atlantica]